MSINILQRFISRTRAAAALIAMGSFFVAPTTRAATTNVVFSNYTFTPETVTIQAGDTVVWTNAGGIHTVTGDGADPFCGAGYATTCSNTFTTAGTFPYHCVFHQSIGMVGTVIVTAVTTMQGAGHGQPRIIKCAVCG
jgi:plastocyanin